MKNILKTFGLHLGVFSILVLTFGIAYAAWDSTVNTGDQLTASSWNELVGKVKNMDSNLNFSSGNMGIGTDTPNAQLDIDGQIKFGNSNKSTGAGMGNWSLRSKHNHGDLAEFYYYNNSTNPRLDIIADNDGISLASNYTNSAGELRFISGGVEKMRISKIGNVGIGTTNPGGPLHIDAGESGASVSPSSELVIEDNVDVKISLLTKNTYKGKFLFSDPEDTGAGRIEYDHVTDSLRFDTAGSEKFRLDNAGALTLSNLSGTYSGGSAFVCVNNSGVIYASEAACP